MRLTVALGARSYPVDVVAGGLEGLGAAMAEVLRPGRAALVTNPVVGALYRDAALASLRGAGFDPVCLEVPDGEAHKTVATWAALVEGLLAAGVDRATPVVALGGGVTGDIAGFAAATALRGVPFVAVPTTLLAMVDSSVGGKTGVNSPAGKNLVGAFHQPSLVYAAVQTLRTLPDDELRCGLGEVLKHGVIADGEILALAVREADRVRAADPAVLVELVARNVRVKAAIVAEDERETGVRAVLNLGHTVGHAVERAAGFGALRHGECVAMGTLAEARWAAARGACDPSAPDAIARALHALGLPDRPPPGLAGERLLRSALVAAAGHDKKLVRGTLSMPVVHGIGCTRVHPIAAGEVSKLFDYLPGVLEE